jgi:hypothetical protein
MVAMVCHTKFLFYYSGDTCPRPHIPTKTEGFGAASQKCWQQGTLVSSQPARRARRFPVTQGIISTDFATRNPLADRALADPKGVGNHLLFPTLLVERPGA